MPLSEERFIARVSIRHSVSPDAVRTILRAHRMGALARTTEDLSVVTVAGQMLLEDNPPASDVGRDHGSRSRCQMSGG
jgi:hypothetical protein